MSDIHIPDGKSKRKRVRTNRIVDNCAVLRVRKFKKLVFVRAML